MDFPGAPNIEEMKARKNVKALIKALKYKRDLMYVPISGVTLWEAEPGNYRAMQAIFATTVRSAAAKALGEIGDNRAKKPSSPFLRVIKKRKTLCARPPARH